MCGPDCLIFPTWRGIHVVIVHSGLESVPLSWFTHSLIKFVTLLLHTAVFAEIRLKVCEDFQQQILLDSIMGLILLYSHSLKVT